MKNIDETGAMKLRIEATEGGYDLWLDDKRLHHIKDYKIESIPSGPYAELSLKLLVQYPTTRENAS